MGEGGADWQIELRDRRLIGENQCFRVHFDHVCSGTYSVPDYLVVTPKGVGSGLAAGVGVLPCHGGRIGLLRIQRHAIGEELWEIPRGFLEPSEAPSFSALRELEEEVGLHCEPAQLVPLGTVLPEPGVLRARSHLFAAKVEDAGQIRSGTELGHRWFQWFVFDEVEDMVRNNRIEDASTLAALYRYSLTR